MFALPVTIDFYFEFRTIVPKSLERTLIQLGSKPDPVIRYFKVYTCSNSCFAYERNGIWFIWWLAVWCTLRKWPFNFVASCIKCTKMCSICKEASFAFLWITYLTTCIASLLYTHICRFSSIQFVKHTVQFSFDDQDIWKAK